MSHSESSGETLCGVFTSGAQTVSHIYLDATNLSIYTHTHTLRAVQLCNKGGKKNSYYSMLFFSVKLDVIIKNSTGFFRRGW